MRIPKGLLQIARIADGDPGSYHAGVAVTRTGDGTFELAATDGRCAIILRHGEPDGDLIPADTPVPGFTAVIPATTAIDADKAVHKHAKPAAVTLDEVSANERLRLVSPSKESTVTTFDCAAIAETTINADKQTVARPYPDIKAVTPNYKVLAERDDNTAVAITVSIHILSKLLAALDSHPDNESGTVTLIIPTKRSRAIRLVVPNVAADAVLIPLGENATDEALKQIRAEMEAVVG